MVATLSYLRKKDSLSSINSLTAKAILNPLCPFPRKATGCGLCMNREDIAYGLLRYQLF